MTRTCMFCDCLACQSSPGGAPVRVHVAFRKPGTPPGPMVQWTPVISLKAGDKRACLFEESSTCLKLRCLTTAFEYFSASAGASTGTFFRSIENFRECLAGVRVTKDGTERPVYLAGSVVSSGAKLSAVLLHKGLAAAALCVAADKLPLKQSVATVNTEALCDVVEENGSVVFHGYLHDALSFISSSGPAVGSKRKLSVLASSALEGDAVSTVPSAAAMDLLTILEECNLDPRLLETVGFKHRAGGGVSLGGTVNPCLVLSSSGDAARSSNNTLLEYVYRKEGPKEPIDLT